MIVVDTNVISYLYLHGEFTHLAESALKTDPDWHAPILWRSEFRSVLSLYVRKKVLSLNDAQTIAQRAEAFMQGREGQVPADSVLALAARSRCSAYDCEFVALAQVLGAVLVTSDKKIVADFPLVSMHLRDFAGRS